MSKTESYSEATLFERHIAGDDAAFGELFQRWNHRLYLYSLKLVNDSDRAEDIVQELWEKVIRLRAAPQHVENPVGLFLKMARNLCLNQLRARKRETLLPGETEWSTLGAQRPESESEFDETVQVGLLSLSVEDREVLILSIYWGYSMQEIAVLMNKSAESVWKRASRARQRLRKNVLKLMQVHDNRSGHTGRSGM
jgi:RNA polymerase sigma-70 factor, ECF subfamily